MNEKVRVSIVSYLNSAPFLYGLQNSSIRDRIELTEDYPAACYEKLKSGAVDIGLVPVAALTGLANAHIISDYCIGCDGAVSSVLLVSRVPVDKIEKVLLDYQSRTSVQLVRVLAKDLWHIAPEWQESVPGYEELISGTTGAVIIGDRAMEHKHRFEYVYDLGTAWKELTGLPFVFAVWASNREMDPGFLTAFNAALSGGIQSLEEQLPLLKRPFADVTTITEYLKRHIRYDFGKAQKKGLSLFLSMIK
jgi:chorismate dehydratase